MQFRVELLKDEPLRAAIRDFVADFANASLVAIGVPYALPVAADQGNAADNDAGLLDEAAGGGQQQDAAAEEGFNDVMTSWMKGHFLKGMPKRDAANSGKDQVEIAGEEIATAIEGVETIAQVEPGEVEADTQVKVAADEDGGEGEGAAAKDEPKVMNADATLSDDEFFDAADSVEEELALAEERSSP